MMFTVAVQRQLFVALNDFGYAVGSGQGGFYKLPYVLEMQPEKETYVLNNFYRRALPK